MYRQLPVHSIPAIWEITGNMCFGSVGEMVDCGISFSLDVDLHLLGVLNDNESWSCILRVGRNASV